MSPKVILIFMWACVIILGMSLVALADPTDRMSDHCKKEGHWYDSDCCSCDDCRPVKPGEVEAWADDKGEGFRHSLTGRVWYWGHTGLRPSKDGGGHLCWPPGHEFPNCFLLGPEGIKTFSFLPKSGILILSKNKGVDPMTRLQKIQKTLVEATGLEFPIVAREDGFSWIEATYGDLSKVEEKFGEKKAQSLLIASRPVTQRIDNQKIIFISRS